MRKNDEKKIFPNPNGRLGIFFRSLRKKITGLPEKVFGASGKTLRSLRRLFQKAP